MLYTQAEKLPASNHHFSRLFMNMVVVTTLAFLIIIFALNAVFMEPLFRVGVNFIHIMQTGFESKVFAVFMNIFSIICNTPVIAVIFLLQMGIAKHKLKAIIHLSFFLIGFHIIAILKQAYQQSRPIWVSSQINNWEWFCPTDFGNPSGHSYVAFPLFEPIISKYIGFEKLKVAWAFVILFGIVVPFSRMYLGVHSLNQIFFGFSFGMAWILMYRYGLRQLFYKIFSCMLKLKKFSHLFAAILIHVILMMIPLVIYKIRSENTPLAQMDLDNLNRICGKSIDSLSIQSSMFAICILHSVAFGFMYGFFALKYRRQSKLYFMGRWIYKNKISALLHCVAQILCAGVVPVMVVIGFGSLWKEGYSRFFVFNVALTIGAFLYIWLTEKFERRYGWVNYEQKQTIVIEGQIYPKTSDQLAMNKTLEDKNMRYV